MKGRFAVDAPDVVAIHTPLRPKSDFAGYLSVPCCYLEMSLNGAENEKALTRGSDRRGQYPEQPSAFTIALTYIHGIGSTTLAKEITEKTGNHAEERRVQELSDAEILRIREAIDAGYTVEGGPAPRDRRQYQAPDGPRLL